MTRIDGQVRPISRVRRLWNRMPPGAKSVLWFVGLWAVAVLCFAAAVFPLRALVGLLF